MAIFDLLSGFKGLENQFEEAQDLAREKYDPSQLDPVLDYFAEQAREGISPEEEAARRTQTIRSLFGQQTRTPSGLTGGRQLAASQGQSLARSGGLSQFETQMSIEDVRAQQRGEQGLAQTQAQARGIESQQEAALEEAELQFEAEKDRRTQQAIGTAANIAGSLLTTPFGPGMASLAGRGLTELFGGEGFGDLSKKGEAGQGPSAAENLAADIGMEQLSGLVNQFTGASADMTADVSPRQQATSGRMDFSFLDNQTPRATNAVEAAQRNTEQRNERADAGQENFLEQAFMGTGQTFQFGVPDQPLPGLGGQPQTQDENLIGDRAYGSISNFLGRLAGPVGQGTFDVTTRGGREALNILHRLFRGAPNIPEAFDIISDEEFQFRNPVQRFN